MLTYSSFKLVCLLCCQLPPTDLEVKPKSLPQATRRRLPPANSQIPEQGAVKKRVAPPKLGPFPGRAGLGRAFPSPPPCGSSRRGAPSPPAAMDYPEAAGWAAEHVRSYRKDPSGWRSCKRTNEISISWRPSTEFHGNLYKAEGIMPAKPADVFKCIKPETGGLREKWDPNVKEVTVVDTINENVVIVRTTTPSAFMKVISPREFLDVVLTKEDEDGTICSTATNVEHPLCQPQPNYMRGLNYPCGCFCIPAPGDPCKTQLLSFFQTDLCGNLPQTVVESFIPSSISGFYSNLTKAVVKLVA
ncbi:hypothetical protein lerEdw1_010999 [Lerista edwardsae]|nr:hypothetical protein lerEdw1_010999 [Lerista edwardsae]